MVRLIKQDVFSVGPVDYNVRSFHGYTTPFGATYNSYLINDEKVTLIDTCKEPFADELIENVSKVTDLSKVRYIIANHAEPDHSGALLKVMKAMPGAEVIASSPMGGRDLRLYYGDVPVTEIKSGGELNIGKRTLKFVSTPMVHWPDNMVTYDAADKILFSNDAFGEHYAASKPFDTENELGVILKEAKKYYANIVLPYSGQAAKALESVSGLDFDTVCPSHGVVWTKHLPDILSLYKKWTTGAKEDTAIIAYSTMWHSTERMASAVREGFEQKGLKVHYYDLDHAHPSDIMTELMTAKYIAVGSSTLNNNLLPLCAGFLTYMKGLAPSGLKGFAFGSYGWSGQSIPQVEQMLKDAEVEIILPQQKAQFAPTKDQLKALALNVENAL